MSDLDIILDDLEDLPILDDEVDEYLDAEIDQLCCEESGINMMLDKDVDALVETKQVLLDESAMNECGDCCEDDDDDDLCEDDDDDDEDDEEECAPRYSEDRYDAYYDNISTVGTTADEIEDEEDDD